MSETKTPYSVNMQEALRSEPNTLIDREQIAIKLEERKGLLILLRAKETELRQLGWMPHDKERTA